MWTGYVQTSPYEYTRTAATTTQPRHTAIPTRVFATANENYALLQSSATAFRPNAPRSVPLPLVKHWCRTFALLGSSAM